MGTDSELLVGLCDGKIHLLFFLCSKRCNGENTYDKFSLWRMEMDSLIIDISILVEARPLPQITFVRLLGRAPFFSLSLCRFWFICFPFAFSFWPNAKKSREEKKAMEEALRERDWQKSECIRKTRISVVETSGKRLLYIFSQRGYIYQFTTDL